MLAKPARISRHPVAEALLNGRANIAPTVNSYDALRNLALKLVASSRRGGV